MKKKKILNTVQSYFYVRPSTVRGKPGTLYLRLVTDGRPMVCSIPQLKLTPKDFDKRGQAVRLSCPLHQQGNELIGHVRQLVLQAAMSAEAARRIMKPDGLRKALQNFFSPAASGSSLTFLEVFDLHLAEQKLMIGKELSRATYEIRSRYRRCLSEALTAEGLEGLCLSELTPGHAETLRNRLLATYALGYAGRIYTAVSSVFNYAKSKGYLTDNPIAEVRKIRIDKSPDLFWLEPYQVQALMAMDLSHQPASERLRDAFVFCCFTGLSIGDYELLNPERQAELISKADSPRRIEPGRIETLPSGRQILTGHRRKTGTRYRVPLEPEALALLEKYGGVGGLPYSLFGVGNLLNQIVAPLNLPRKIRFHTARKTKANYLLNVKRIHPYYAIEIMGWKRIDEATPYTQVSAETLSEQLHGTVTSL
jgi:integrase